MSRPILQGNSAPLQLYRQEAVHKNTLRYLPQSKSKLDVRFLLEPVCIQRPIATTRPTMHAPLSSSAEQVRKCFLHCTQEWLCHVKYAAKRCVDLGSCVPTTNMATDVAQASQVGHVHRISQETSRLIRQRLSKLRGPHMLLAPNETLDIRCVCIC